jgi:hypothetical protein
MPRKRSSLGIAAGKLLMTIQSKSAVAVGAEQVLANKVVKRAQTLLQATHQDYVLGLLDGKNVAEYLDSQWVAAHADVQQCVDAVTTQLQQLK